MKYIKNFDYFDTADLKDKFTPDEIKKLAKTDSPYDKNYKKFQADFYSGAGSNELNDLIHNAKYKKNEYGISEFLYDEIIKKIPFLKEFEVKKDNDFSDGKIGIWLKKEKKLEGTRFNAESEIWINYMSKSDDIFDYEEGKIKILFVCGLRPTKKSFGLFDDDTEPEIKKSFNNISSKNDDDNFDNFYKKVSDKLYGHPDESDEKLSNKLKVSYKNLNIKDFLLTLPEIKGNLDYFRFYLKNKYKLEF